LNDGSLVTIPSGAKVESVAPAQNATALSATDAANAERAQRRAKMMQVCGADIKKYCSDQQQGFAVFQCMRQNLDKLSDPCQQLFKNMRGGGGQRGGGFGGGGFGGGRPPG